MTAPRPEAPLCPSAGLAPGRSRSDAGVPLRWSEREGGLTLHTACGDWVRLDLAGRWRALALGGVTYRRALSGQVTVARSRLWRRERYLDVEPLAGDARARIHEEARVLAEAALAPGGLDLAPAWRQALQAAARADATACGVDAEEFHRVYVGSPITPPDQSEAVLVQSTVGCAHAACTFCTFYRGVPFTIRSAAAFGEHVEAVRAHLGPTLAARHRVFLGDASALMVKPALLHRHMELARTLLPPCGNAGGDFSVARGVHYRPTHPFSTFCDAFLTPLPCHQDLRALADAGLDRVYLGMESGAPAVLGLVRKPATPEGMLEAAARLHEAGIRLSVIVLLGVGGRALAQSHLDQTVALVQRMGLRHGDIVQFSELFVPGGSAYERIAEERGIEPMGREECRAQMLAMKERLALPDRARGVRMQMYDARVLLY